MLGLGVMVREVVFFQEFCQACDVSQLPQAFLLSHQLPIYFPKSVMPVLREPQVAGSFTTLVFDLCPSIQNSPPEENPKGLLYTQTRQLVIYQLAGMRKKILHYLFCLVRHVRHVIKHMCNLD